MHVPLLDLQPQYAALRTALDACTREVIESQQFILGPAVEAFERDLAAYLGVGHVVGTSSGTDAQLALLMALDVGPGDAVVTTPYTFFATAGCVTRTGARPVFVDVDPATLNLCPRALDHYLTRVARRDAAGQLRAPTGERLRAVVPVHLFGLAAEAAAIGQTARAHGLDLLEDASQALVAEAPGAGPADPARRVGRLGRAAWFSFFPSKNLGAFGDAGAVVTDEPALAEKLRALRTHGETTRYHHRYVGGNFRLDALQAAVLRTKLPHLPGWLAARRERAATYRARFARAGLTDRPVRLPAEPYAGCGLREHHTYHQFVVRVPARDRDPLRAHLAARGVGTGVYYPVPLHRQECFRDLDYREGDFPVAEAAARESLALPIYPELTPEQQAHVVAAAREYFG